MNFANTQYLPHILGAIVFFLILMIYLNQKYFNWVKTYWFFERSWMSRFSSIVYFLSICLILISLLDLRGPEERVKTSLPDQKTIIVLDSSSSMLAEDVRPSRYGKAIQIARHFVKSAAGHQISIVLFSDIQKKLIPFTDDIDLLDSRLAALEKNNSVSGGSNISQAIAEAASYFDADDDQKAASGNILVFTDAEEGEEAFKLELGDNVNLAVVGIGTAKGGNIPLRWEDGSFRGYKSVKSEPVLTKLDENYIRNLGKNVKNYKYWIANSYSLPTEDLLNFFKGNYNKLHGKGDMRIRPVFSHLILIPAILMYCLSIVLGRFASFKTVMSFALLFLLFGSSELMAKDQKSKPVEKELPLSLKRDMEKMKSGKADRKEILKIAENLLKNNEDEKAKALYTEYAKADDDQAVIFNRATALLKVGELDQAMPYIQQVFKTAKTEKMKDEMRHNILMAMNNEGRNKDKNKDKDKEEKENEEKDKDKEDKKEGDKGKEEDKGEGKKDGKNKEGEGKDSKDNKSGSNSGKDTNEGEGKDKKEDKKKDPKDLEAPPRPEPQDLESKEKDIKQKRKMTQTPAVVKQILSDDRELQKKMMDTSTNKRGSQKEKRDW